LYYYLWIAYGWGNAFDLRLEMADGQARRYRYPEFPWLAFNNNPALSQEDRISFM
jgi:hypothetical protein